VADQGPSSNQQKHAHPGGAGAVLGVRVMRNSSVQGLTLVIGNVMQLVSTLVVASFLGPSELARFGLLMFLAGLTTQLTSLLCKPGTVRRTFGGGGDDDDDDDSDEDDDTSSSPPRTLGTGLAWAVILGVLASILIYVFRVPIANVLLGGDTEDVNLVALAGLQSGALVVFKICDITLWLERRPAAFLICDTARPLLGLIVLTAFLATGSGVEGAMIGTIVGTAVAGVVGLILLTGSYEPSFDVHEIWEIIKRGGYRAPIVMSFWVIQNADIFILSRFVSHEDLGVYHLASRLGFVVSFLPQGFRMGMRPMRKSAAYDAYKEQYGKATAGGQLLAYFTLICILAVLWMVLLGQVLVDVVGPKYANAASLIPLTALSFVGPAMYRTVNQNVNLPNKRPMFVGGVIAAAVMFIGVTWLLAPHIGVFAAPIGMIVAFYLPALFLYIKGQRNKPLAYPYRQISTALALALAIAGVNQLLPEYNHWIELVVAFLFGVVWIALLIPLRVIPEQHVEPLMHMIRSFRRGTPASFRPRRGLRSLDHATREDLRLAVVHRLPLDRLRPDVSGEGLMLTRALRQVGKRGGIPVGEETEHDAEMAIFLFESASTAVRNASMRGLLEKGAESNDLRSMEDLVTTLGRAPVEAWEDEPVNKKRLGRRGRRRRAAAQLRERAASSS
jgi:O-antigen/teichoic acid export membrane protein